MSKITPDRVMLLAMAVEFPQTAEEGVAMVSALMRRIPLHVLVEFQAKMEKSESLGPLLNPTAWLEPGSFDRHRACTDVYRRITDLRRTIQEADEVCDHPALTEDVLLK